MQNMKTDSAGWPLVETEVLQSKHGVTIELTWQLRIFQEREGIKYVRKLAGIKVVSLDPAIDWMPIQREY